MKHPEPPIPELLMAVVDWSQRQGADAISKLEGVWSGETDEYRVRINGHREEIDNVPPFSAAIEHKDYFRIAIVGPGGGALTGVSEGDLIAHFEAA